jgi:hypothetical protein
VAGVDAIDGRTGKTCVRGVAAIDTSGGLFACLSTVAVSIGEHEAATPVPFTRVVLATQSAHILFVEASLQAGVAVYVSETAVFVFFARV